MIGISRTEEGSRNMAATDGTTPQERAGKRVKNFTDLMWHVATFVIVNGFLWAIDLMQGGGLNWAYWVTISWGIGLAFHVAAYLLDTSGLQNRRYHKYLAEEERRGTQDSADN
jgi:hypothetical protein